MEGKLGLQIFNFKLKMVKVKGDFIWTLNALGCYFAEKIEESKLNGMHFTLNTFPGFFRKLLELLKDMETMPYSEYIQLIQREGGPELIKLRRCYCDFLVENGGLYSIRNGEDWDF